MRSPAVDLAEILASQEGMCDVCAALAHEESGNMTFCMENKLGRGAGNKPFPPRNRERNLMGIRWVFLVTLGELPATSELSVTSLVRKQIHMVTFCYLC